MYKLIFDFGNCECLNFVLLFKKYVYEFFLVILVKYWGFCI